MLGKYSTTEPHLQPPYSLFIQSETEPQEIPLHVRWVSSLQLNLETSPQACPEVYLLDDSKPCQIDVLTNTGVIAIPMAANVVACLQSRAGLEDSSVNPVLGAKACISSLE